MEVSRENLRNILQECARESVELFLTVGFGMRRYWPRGSRCLLRTALRMNSTSSRCSAAILRVQAVSVCPQTTIFPVGFPQLGPSWGNKLRELEPQGLLTRLEEMEQSKRIMKLQINLTQPGIASAARLMVLYPFPADLF